MAYDRLPPNVGTINDLSGMFGGVIVHGETATEIDVEFKNIKHALCFIAVMNDPDWQWPCELRDSYSAIDVAELLTKPVTVTVTKDF